MFKLKQLIVRDILEATKGELKYGNVDMVVKNISTDSRSVNEGDLFNRYFFILDKVSKKLKISRLTDKFTLRGYKRIMEEDEEWHRESKQD